MAGGMTLVAPPAPSVVLPPTVFAALQPLDDGDVCHITAPFTHDLKAVPSSLSAVYDRATISVFSPNGKLVQVPKPTKQAWPFPIKFLQVRAANIGNESIVRPVKVWRIVIVPMLHSFLLLSRAV